MRRSAMTYLAERSARAGVASSPAPSLRRSPTRVSSSGSSTRAEASATCRRIGGGGGLGAAGTGSGFPVPEPANAGSALRARVRCPGRCWSRRCPDPARQRSRSAARSAETGPAKSHRRPATTCAAHQESGLVLVNDLLEDTGASRQQRGARGAPVGVLNTEQEPVRAVGPVRAHPRSLPDDRRWRLNADVAAKRSVVPRSRPALCTATPASATARSGVCASTALSATVTGSSLSGARANAADARSAQECEGRPTAGSGPHAHQCACGRPLRDRSSPSDGAQSATAERARWAAVAV